MKLTKKEGTAVEAEDGEGTAVETPVENSDVDCSTCDEKKSPAKDNKDNTENTEMSEMLSPGGTLEEDVESLLLDHYYRLEVTEIEAGVVTLAWHFPPGNPRDCSTWLGFYPILGQKPMPPEFPSNDLFDGRAAFKYVTKNSSSGVVRFNLTQCLKSKEDGIYFFAMQAHSLGTIFATSKTVQVKDGEISSFEKGLDRMAPHDGMQFLRKPRERATSMETHVADRLPAEMQPQPWSKQPKQLRKPKLDQPPLDQGESSRGRPGRKPKLRENDSIGESPQDSERLRASSEAPVAEFSENDDEDLDEDSYFTVKVERSEGHTVHVSWRFPPGNPSDSSSYVSLYPSAEWLMNDGRPVTLPWTSPGPGGLGYKYITTNGTDGKMKFVMVNNPKRDFKNGSQYVFALHYEDKVYALSQPMTLEDLHVVHIAPVTAMRRVAFRETARGRGVRRPGAERRQQSPSSQGTDHQGDVSPGGSYGDVASSRGVTGFKKRKMDPDEQEDGAVHNALKQLERTKATTGGESGPPKKRLRDMVFSDEESEEEVDPDESWTFVCICGKQGENYDDGTAMVECEKCNQWQHAACVGMDNSSEDDTYICWRCEKMVPVKKKRSGYQGSQHEGHSSPAKTNDADAVQLLNMLRTSGSPQVKKEVKGENGAGDADSYRKDAALVTGTIRLQFDLGFGHSFALPVPRSKRLMEMTDFVESALHQSGPGQMLLVSQLTDRHGNQLPSTAADGGNLLVGHIFAEMDVVAVICRQRGLANSNSRTTASKTMPYSLPV